MPDPRSVPSLSLDGINRQVRVLPSPSGPQDISTSSIARTCRAVRTWHAREAIIIYLFGHLLLIPASICFRAKALLGVINLVSVSPHRAAAAACPPSHAARPPAFCLPASRSSRSFALGIERASERLAFLTNPEFADCDRQLKRNVVVYGHIRLPPRRPRPPRPSPTWRLYERSAGVQIN